ncbi:MAG: LysR family transcriptional regulator [Bifidobacteriaceae bacterium]|jgi:DNA-binding MarR family transcriptional regulator|nr:LysR family transcriptional regulator [Bifidobacteriaceae bacterium]MCI1978665.1 LysR family transcriptional regulator [Bifidobacteriaceae bacterium]
MIEPYLLEELAAFSETGTLAAVAEKLYVTQPSVTRGMQKLEQELGVHLFERTPNRITLTETGRMAAKQAADLLKANDDMVAAIRNFDRNQNRLRLRFTIPGPRLLFNEFFEGTDAGGNDTTDGIASDGRISLTPTLLSSDEAGTVLHTRNADLVISNENMAGGEVASAYLGTEKLYVNLDKFMYEASQPEVSFAQLKELSFIVLDDIGPWKGIIQKEIPQAKFLYQQQPDAFVEITQYSNFPYFSSSLSIHFDPSRAITDDDDRIPVPLSDPAAQMRVYANYLVEKEPLALPLIRRVREMWPRPDDPLSRNG